MSETIDDAPDDLPVTCHLCDAEVDLVDRDDETCIASHTRKGEHGLCPASGEVVTGFDETGAEEAVAAEFAGEDDLLGVADDPE